MRNATIRKLLPRHLAVTNNASTNRIGLDFTQKAPSLVWSFISDQEDRPAIEKAKPAFKGGVYETTGARRHCCIWHAYPS